MTHRFYAAFFTLSISILASAQTTEAQAPTIVPVSQSAVAASDLSSRSVDTQASVELAHAEYVAEDARIGRQIRRLRIAGWSMFSAGTTLLMAGSALLMSDLRNADIIFISPASVGMMLTGTAVAILGGSLLVTARFRIGRQHRLRQEYERERAYFRPEAEVGVAPGGLNFRLTF